MVNDIIYVTNNGGVDWVESTILPSSFDYVIEREDLFLFPEGVASVPKPTIDGDNYFINRFDQNELGDIAILLYDQSVTENNWLLMLYVRDLDEWIIVDQLEDLGNRPSGIPYYYTTINITNEKTIFISHEDSDLITKYYVD